MDTCLNMYIYLFFGYSFYLHSGPGPDGFPILHLWLDVGPIYHLGAQKECLLSQINWLVRGSFAGTAGDDMAGKLPGWNQKSIRSTVNLPNAILGYSI